MLSATRAFPWSMMAWIIFATSTSPYTGSGWTTLLDTNPLLGMRKNLLVRLLRTSPERQDSGVRPTPRGAVPEPTLSYPSRQTRRGPDGTTVPIVGKLFGSLGAVLRPRLPSVLDADGIQLPADDVVANAGEVLHAPPPDHDHGVLLEVVPLARDVHGHLDAVGEADPRHLAECGVRLLRRRGVDAEADSPLLGAAFERRGVALVGDRLPPLPDQLVDRGHSLFPSVERVLPVLPDESNLYSSGFRACQRLSSSSRGSSSGSGRGGGSTTSGGSDSKS